MNNIPKHKTFISYHHGADQQYKDKLVMWNDAYGLFDNYSVNEKDIDDKGKSDETIRCIIRDEYIKDSTVIIILCGSETKRRKFIDWEINAGMFDTEKNPKTGFLIINLPTINQMELSSNEDKKHFINSNWSSFANDRASLECYFQYLPSRILDNLEKPEIKITIINWLNIAFNPSCLKELIHSAFNNKTTNNYDTSTPLRRKNS
ncbi:MAG: TIR domain-containing protein [Mycoplasma sp.]